ncbi:hypothetical protein RVS70_05425 [Virgibacillus sp. M23]|uniref:hypothetical protein n=1 Tax=Virgibacillus sp. M23 TaxID=3079030 RepID=UPI002A90891A|nr:hypothetical protein [Virgibacillus sp. M23]MDY7043642.1 hypothetical protein [Virgibacillus sp. M23]
MKGLIKKDMMEYRVSGLRVMEKKIENSDILNDEDLGEQIKRHLENFMSISSEMKFSMLKHELKIKYKELIKIARTIDYIIENREKLKDVMNWRNEKIIR